MPIRHGILNLISLLHIEEFKSLIVEDLDIWQSWLTRKIDQNIFNGTNWLKESVGATCKGFVQASAGDRGLWGIASYGRLREADPCLSFFNERSLLLGAFISYGK